MRLGGPVFGWSDPASWVEAHRRWGYRAAYFPADVADPDAFAAAARDADLLIAEIGIWNNLFTPNEEERTAAFEKCVQRLRLADRVGARCTVNIAGSRGNRWDGPFAADLAPDAMSLVASTIQRIVDEVRPNFAKYSVETMPYMLPDSAETSLEMVKAVDRKAFGIHFDPVNLINSPRRFFENGAFVRNYIERVGPHITAIHLKDIVLEPKLTTHLQEVRPGLGKFDIAELFRVVEGEMEPDTPVLLEHLESEEQYRLANEHVREVAARAGISL